MVNRSAAARNTNDIIVDVFTHSSTGFPGAWTEEEISTLLNAWEQALDAKLQSTGKVFYTLENILNTLTNRDFRKVLRNDVIKQMNTLRTEYKVYLGLVKIGIPTVKASCVPQLERILQKATIRRKRRRRTSAASNQVEKEKVVNVDLDESEEPGSTEETNGAKRVTTFQRQALQRLLQTLLDQQQAILDNLQEVFDKINESNRKMILLLEQLVTLQKNPHYTKSN